jgi:hypothetical protein
MPLGTRGLVHPRLMLSVERITHNSTVTFQAKTLGEPSASGARLPVWTDVDEDHTDLPCMIAPVTGAGASTGATSGEVRADTGVYDVDARTVSILRHLPDITEKHRAVIDDVNWQIVDVAWDSQHTQTRLRVRKVSGTDDTADDGGS